MITRTLAKSLFANAWEGKAIVVQGARQVGKTTLLKAILKAEKDVLWINGDLRADRELWSAAAEDLSMLRRYLSGYRYVVFDEAQRITNIGLLAKIVVDAALPVRMLLLGSSSINLASNINEALTGRKWTFELYPLTWKELTAHYKLYSVLQTLDERLIFGSYPEVVTNAESAQRRLEEISSSYLYKDILDYGDIRKPELVEQLLRSLAYQVGSQVSYHELATSLQVSSETIRRYIQLLEESYVIFRLQPLSTNPRKEIFTSRKIYFLDNGIRNALINNLSPLNLRNDVGILWENFIISEWYKQAKHAGKAVEFYFWRSKSGSEIDLVRAVNGKYEAYEIKYSAKKKGRFAPSFVERYNPECMETINRENFFEYWEK